MSTMVSKQQYIISSQQGAQFCQQWSQGSG